MASSEKDPPKNEDLERLRKWLASRIAVRVRIQQEALPKFERRPGGPHPTVNVLKGEVDRLCREEERIRQEIALLERVPPDQAPTCQSTIPKKSARRRVKSAKPKHIRFERSGDRISAEPEFTDRQLLKTYNLLASILKKVRAYVLDRHGEVPIADLKKAFPDLSPFSNDEQLKKWVEDFSKKATARNIALVYLEKTTGLERSTIKSRLSRARRSKKEKK